MYLTFEKITEFTIIWDLEPVQCSHLNRLVGSDVEGFRKSSK